VARDLSDPRGRGSQAKAGGADAGGAAGGGDGVSALRRGGVVGDVCRLLSHAERPQRLPSSPPFLLQQRSFPTTPSLHPTTTPSYENIVQIRCLYEGVGVDEMLATWHSTMLPSYMQKWQLDRNKVRWVGCEGGG